ncbi:hypothetical protein LMG28688_05784 [Paraburkholderia caffeinitolerans]|uniref:Phage baseplate protein n=1 Tax=Paraburkholderia caffeinitolerans TaxID=1723730 RepID=A0A6J5GPS5_9BURK|nr:phage baseplate protein [Paraburkholderia caffeinitolerans]CAB3803416.1 hypothetical protein LMG28688_05784 [Paraburkholderia caffeinitolerans]
MRPLSAAELLCAWEDGLSRGPVDRALVLLAAASPEAAPDSLAALPIGERDSRLLALRAWIFGATLASRATCPECGEQVEFSFDAASRFAPWRNEPPQTEIGISFAGYDLCLRPPNSIDMAALSLDSDAEARRSHLFARSLVSASKNGDPVGADRLPPEVVAAAAEALAKADPLADMRVDLGCPTCEYRWQAPFDIVPFFWSEIEAWACRILREVHVLARAYGWSERDILELSPARRQAYIELAGS